MNTKNEVLKILKNNLGNNISGADIAQKLGVSRAAVWKAVQALRNEGYVIHAVTHTGYKLEHLDNVIDLDEIQKSLQTKTFARNILLLDQVSSTNDTAKEKARENAPEGTLIIAKRQTAGKGRYGRTFHSPGNGNIYMSILLKPIIDVKDASFMTITAAVAVNQAIREICGIDSKIKWVNDIYIGSKKVCGILTEAGFEMETSSLNYVIAGIGINISAHQLPDEIKDIACDIQSNASKTFSVNHLIAEILNNFEDLYFADSKQKIIENYRTMSCVLGNKITFEKDGIKQVGFAQEIDDNGALIVALECGKQFTIASGEISIRLIK